MKKQLEKLYEPKAVEDCIYKYWTDGNYFHARVNPDKKPYTIVIPPPSPAAASPTAISRAGGTSPCSAIAPKRT